MHVPTPRQTPRRHAPARAALFTLLGLLAAACGASEEPASTAGPESQEVLLQPVAAAGPDPFTATSAIGESAPAQPSLPNPTGQGIRTVNAATPGLYGGTQRLSSCDVEAQLRALTEDGTKAKAFAQAASVETAKIPEFLRGLTPVVLRADTRVTNHSFRDGRAEGFQSVLQAGTAVLVDDHGMPRVRCACGNPLLAPRAPKGSPALKGDKWSGYQPHQVIVIEPTPHAIKSLVIVNTTDNTWLERKTGDDGAQDRTPQAVPAYDPAQGIPTGHATRPGASPAEPCAPPETDAGANAGTNNPARTAPPAPPKPPGGPLGVPAPEATDCVPVQSAPDRQAQPAKPAPSAPQRPGRPRVPPRSDAPANPPVPPRSDAPANPSGDLPPDSLADQSPQGPAAPGLPPAPDALTPLPSDTGDPHAPDGSRALDDPFTPHAPDGSHAPDDPFTPRAPDGSLTPDGPLTPHVPDGSHTPDDPFTPHAPDGSHAPDDPFTPHAPDGPHAPDDPFTLDDPFTVPGRQQPPSDPVRYLESA
ncbi:DUF6777 domain-containing protein [Streptomyces sp. NPDC097981]|uniref:DUF6777 domain-containing protein n=1 Tax=Streptomyces sp. NPDC097981 TaxID=3155428 RepID=UPI00331D9A96